MDGCFGLKTFTVRLQRLFKPKSSVQRRSLQISSPFDFKHNNVALPGISDDEITILKEKAAASRLGVASEAEDRARHQAPRAAPAPPTLSNPSVQVTPSTPVSPAENLI